MEDEVNSGNSRLDDAIRQWLKWDKNPTTRSEVLGLVAKGEWKSLCNCMLQRMKFGTAGLRGRMAAGLKCMNDVVVLQTAQGLCSYFKSVCSKSQLENGVVIGFDGRYNSKRFAELTARVFTCASVPVHLFSDVCPTPFVSFATIERGCCGGVMVTASHNPKEDNGYKVYWGNGSQIITPHDDNILQAILEHLDIPDEHWEVEGIRSHPLVSDPLEAVMSAYCDYIRGSLSRRVLEQNLAASTLGVYSAMHGVGHEAVSRAFAAANLAEPHCVEEQRLPDPEFPTVTFPNPEEPECLRLGRQLAERVDARLLLVNDPDADRLAVAEYDPSSRQWKVFSGDEMGALLGQWLLGERAGEVSLSDVYLVASIVSSKVLHSVARAEGCRFVETLTGFKWMGNKTHLLLAAGKEPLFAYEEALGYMCGARVPDKDGVSAAVQVASLATDLYKRGSSLREQLQALYSQYGHHTTHNSYYICHDPAVIGAIFQRVRNFHGDGVYPKQVAGYNVVSVHDLVTGVKIPADEETSDGEHCSLDVEGTGLDLPYTSGEMVTLCFDNTLRVTVRTSGTEPKLKFYTELVTLADAGDADQEVMKQRLVKMVEEIMDDLIQPKQNGLLG